MMLLFQVWVWMISIFLTTGLVLGVNWYKPQTKAASPTDMRIIGGLSSVFCYAVTIRSDDNITAYLLDKQPAINSTTRRYLSSPKHTSIAHDKYEYWGYYLLAGSSITVHSCLYKTVGIFSPYLSMYVIKGSDKLASWKSDMDCYDCWQDYRSYSQACDGSSFHGYNYTLNIEDTDDYYFAYANNGNTLRDSVNLTATFDMDRTTYTLKSK